MSLSVTLADACLLPEYIPWSEPLTEIAIVAVRCAERIATQTFLNSQMQGGRQTDATRMVYNTCAYHAIWNHDSVSAVHCNLHCGCYCNRMA